MVYAPYSSYIVCLLSSGVEHFPRKEKVVGSNPTGGSIRTSLWIQEIPVQPGGVQGGVFCCSGAVFARLGCSVGSGPTYERPRPRECLRELRQSGQGRLRRRLPSNGTTPCQKVYGVWLRPICELESNVKALSLQIVTTSMYSYGYGQQDSTCGGNPRSPVGTGVFGNQPERYHAPIRCWSGQYVPPLH